MKGWRLHCCSLYVAYTCTTVATSTASTTTEGSRSRSLLLGGRHSGVGELVLRWGGRVVVDSQLGIDDEPADPPKDESTDAAAAPAQRA